MQLFAGVAWLATVLGALCVALFKWLLDFATRRFGIALLAIAAVVTVTAVFFAAINSLITSLPTYAPAELATACGMVLPTNTAACISAIFAAQIARMVYAFQVRFIGYKNVGAGL